MKCCTAVSRKINRQFLKHTCCRYNSKGVTQTQLQKYQPIGNCLQNGCSM